MEFLPRIPPGKIHQSELDETIDQTGVDAAASSRFRYRYLGGSSGTPVYPHHDKLAFCHGEPYLP
jgi:hypothetical protein